MRAKLQVLHFEPVSGMLTSGERSSGRRPDSEIDAGQRTGRGAEGVVGAVPGGALAMNLATSRPFFSGIGSPQLAPPLQAGSRRSDVQREGSGRNDP